MNIYVGNLSPKTEECQIRRAFEMYGRVDKISIGEKSPDCKVGIFGFVTMPFDNQASRAIKELHGRSLGEHALTVKESGLSL